MREGEYMNKIETIKKICLQETSTNPIQIAMKIMDQEDINIHGPEHHILDGAAFLTAMHNAGCDFNLSDALDELTVRGQKMPGAICGQWGVCGSSASVGAALAIIHQTTPLSDNSYYQDNLFYTSKALEKIGTIGGPRCCKRNAFLSMKTAIEFVKEKYGIVLEDEEVKCHYSSFNRQCIKARCPFYHENNEY